MPKTPAGTAYELNGPRDAPVVTLIHGLGLNGHLTWDSFVPALSQRFRVLRYDLCGHGDTAVPEGQVSLTLLSDQLLALLDALDIDRSAMVGFSLGGMINRRVALDAPSRVTSLAILNSPHERDAEAQAKYEAAARDSAAGGPAATVDAALARWFTPAFHASNPEVIATFRQVVVQNHPENYAAHRFVLAAGVKELVRPNPPITQPTLVMTCENDTGSTPAMARAIADEISGADVEIVPALRHLGLIEQPELFISPLMRFLSRVIDN